MTPYIFIGLMALGLTFVVIAGEIDISVASTLAVCVVVFAEVWQRRREPLARCLSGSLVATGLGLVNGVLVGVLHLPSLAVTLGTLAAYRGLAFVILGGEGIAGFPTGFTNVGGGYVVERAARSRCSCCSASRSCSGVLLHATRFGRYVYAIGSNREAARFSGVPVTACASRSSCSRA